MLHYVNDSEAPSVNYDIMLDTIFNSMNDLEEYQRHPAHMRVVEYIKSLKLQRAAIDYNF